MEKLEVAGEVAEEKTILARRTKDFGFLPIPHRLQWDPTKPPKFGLGMNLVFAFACAFSVANIYYAQPILIVLAEDFNVSYSDTTNIPTLLQASYAAGLVFICPLGDLVRRRQLLLIIIFLAIVLTLILALVRTIIAFEVVSAFLGAVSVAGQILIPLAADLCKPEKRAQSISIVLSGLLLGILIARVLSGVLAEATGKVSSVYFMSLGFQALVWILLWAVCPDYPEKNKQLTYCKILWTMTKYAVTEPVLIQGCLIGITCSAIFTCFWVTSTFLLGDVYNFNSLVIGLFGIVGIAGIFTAPLVGRLVDRMLPWTATLVGMTILLGCQALWTGAAAKSWGAVVVIILALDIGFQFQQVSTSARIFAINAEARSRISAVFIFSIFIGQLLGTSVGSRIYLRYGYRASGALCMGFAALGIFILLLRGPHNPTNVWFGWQDGTSLRKKILVAEEVVPDNRRSDEETKAEGR